MGVSFEISLHTTLIFYSPHHIMPRKSQKKQTRLAFAPAAATPSGDDSADKDDRFRTLAYGHPSLASVRSDRVGKSKASSKKKHTSKTSERDKSPQSHKTSSVEKNDALQELEKQPGMCSYNIGTTQTTFANFRKHKLRFRVRMMRPQMTKLLFPVLRGESDVRPQTLRYS